ncbi:hypothetical protein ACWEO2_27360 [Nocardia sp. NPDC004278]
MPVGTIALIVTAAAILVLCCGIGYWLPYVIDRDRDDTIPDGAVSGVDILDRVTAEGTLRTDSWELEPSHRASPEPYTPEQAHAEMRRHPRLPHRRLLGEIRRVLDTGLFRADRGRREGRPMSVSELPKRSAFVGPQCAVYCDVPTELMKRYLEALNAHEWTDAERPEGAQ